MPFISENLKLLLLLLFWLSVLVNELNILLSDWPDIEVIGRKYFWHNLTFIDINLFCHWPIIVLFYFNNHFVKKWCFSIHVPMSVWLLFYWSNKILTFEIKFLYFLTPDIAFIWLKVRVSILSGLKWPFSIKRKYWIFFKRLESK